MFEGTTWGAEMEVPNWDTRKPLGQEGVLCSEEWEVINHKGVANDPKREFNLIGAEINVTPTDSEEALVERVSGIWDRIGRPEITAGPTLHVHVRVPALFEDRNLPALKRILEYTWQWGPKLLPLISPLPPKGDFKNTGLPEFVEKKVRTFFQAKYRHRHCILRDAQISRVREATTFEECINALATPSKEGKPLWAIHNRGAFNFARMRPRAGATIEFRMFNLTAEEDEIKEIVKFPIRYLQAALDGADPLALFKDCKFPRELDWRSQPVWCNPHCVSVLNLTEMRKTMKRAQLFKNYKALLESREITLADLGYPPIWEDIFGSEYPDLKKFAENHDPGDRFTSLPQKAADVTEIFGGL